MIQSAESPPVFGSSSPFPNQILRMYGPELNTSGTLENCITAAPEIHSKTKYCVGPKQNNELKV